MSVLGQIITQSPLPPAGGAAAGRQAAGNSADSAPDRPFSGLFTEALAAAQGVQETVVDGVIVTDPGPVEGLQELSPGGNPLPFSASAQAQIAPLSLGLNPAAGDIAERAATAGDFPARMQAAGDVPQTVSLEQAALLAPIQAAVLNTGGESQALASDVPTAQASATAQILRTLAPGRDAISRNGGPLSVPGVGAGAAPAGAAEAAGLDELPDVDWLLDRDLTQRLDLAALLQRAKMTGEGPPTPGSMTSPAGGQNQPVGLSGAAPVLAPGEGPQNQPAPVRAAADGLALDIPLRQQGWDEALGNRVTWLVGRNIQRADLQLNPPQLGPLEVRIRMDHEGTSVAFTSHHAAVRDALEAAIPRLREMFGEQGVNLCDVNVSGHSLAGQRDDSSRPDGGAGAKRAGDPADAALQEGEAVLAAALVNEGLLNVFA